MSAKKKTEQGSISIHTENIFPIIKKWLYSEKEIFLRELVSNAVDAIHKMQHVNLMEGLKQSDEYRVDVYLNKDDKTLTIKDNGIGIPDDQIPKLFNLSPSTSRGTNNETGTGLGLMIVKSFIEMNHGVIEVESKVGKGSIFYIKLPADNPVIVSASTL